MVDNKTGGFFRLVLRLLEIESESEPNPELMHLFTLLGRYYQIRDDYLNLASEEVACRSPSFVTLADCCALVHCQERVLRRFIGGKILIPAHPPPAEHC
jgi:geranylgeranyl pyrophosphate synthase